jgi:hypothetical protein
MPGLISVPNSGSFENKENTGNQMGHTNKKILKKNLFENNVASSTKKQSKFSPLLI